jgi:hypothetical protein
MICGSERMSELIYLDNAATSFPKPANVCEFMFEFMHNYGGNPGRSDHGMVLESETIVRSTRKMLCELFNGTHPERITFSYNASDSLNIIIGGKREMWGRSWMPITGLPAARACNVRRWPMNRWGQIRSSGRCVSASALLIRKCILTRPSKPFGKFPP